MQVAPTIPSRSTGGGGLGTDFDCDGGLIAPAVTSKWAKGCGGPAGDECQNLVTHSLRADGFDASEDGTGRGTPLVPVAHCEVMPTMQNGADNEAAHSARSGHTKDSYIVPMVAVFSAGQSEGAGTIGYREEQSPTLRGAASGTNQVPAVAFTCSDQANGFAWERPFAPTLDAQIPNDSSNIQKGVRIGSAVRRLTPRECERLQGFPDNYTLVPFRGKPAADGPRYKALGNSMAVPVMRWIGERIQKAEAL